MTHSLHRCGTIESLKRDYVLLARVPGRPPLVPQLAKIAEIIFEVGPTNTGSSILRTNMALGIDREAFIKHIPETSVILASFSSKEKLRQVLAKLKEADLGMCIVVSGLIDEVISLAQELGLRPHTISLSMGIIGKTEKLPGEDILEITTMCGHGLVASNLVRKAIEDVASGAKSAREASIELAKPCPCGIFNMDRSDLLLALRAGKAPSS
jgi:hypothetical protein